MDIIMFIMFSRYGVSITKKGSYRSTNGVAYTSPKCNRRGTFGFENCDVSLKPCDTEKDALYLKCGGKLLCYMCHDAHYFIRVSRKEAFYFETV